MFKLCLIYKIIKGLWVDLIISQLIAYVKAITYVSNNKLEYTLLVQIYPYNHFDKLFLLVDVPL